MPGLLGAGGTAKYKSATYTGSNGGSNNFTSNINVINSLGIPAKIAKKLSSGNFFGQVTNYNINRGHDYPNSSIACSIISYTPSSGILQVRCSGNYSEILITRFQVHAVWVE